MHSLTGQGRLHGSLGLWRGQRKWCGQVKVGQACPCGVATGRLGTPRWPWPGWVGGSPSHWILGRGQLLLLQNPVHCLAEVSDRRVGPHSFMPLLITRCIFAGPHYGSSSSSIEAVMDSGTEAVTAVALRLSWQ